MTEDERIDLYEQATQLSYLAIRYDDLSPLLSSSEWDELAASIGKEVYELVRGRVDEAREKLEAVHG